MSDKAIVVGAGIGGLTAGVALAKAGWNVEVMERAPALEPIGAGISLWPNALRALDVIGLGDAVRERSALGAGTGVRTPSGKWLARSDVGPALERRYGDGLVVLPRADLLELLANALPPGALKLGVTVHEVHPRHLHAGVTTVEGVDHRADLVVAADGLRSSARAHLFPAHPAPLYAGYTTWRFLTDAPVGVISGSETWGRYGQRFAIVPVGTDRLYCFATARAAEGRTVPDELGELKRRFGTWHDPIPQLLAGLEPAQVLHHDVFDLVKPLPALALGRVALLGDAAHAMQPELGQGGCMAIEDAVTLAAVARPGGDVDEDLARYTGLRLPRTTRVAARVRAAARAAQAEGPIGAPVRALSGRIMGHLPPSALAFGLSSVVDWKPLALRG